MGRKACFERMEYMEIAEDSEVKFTVKNDALVMK